MRHLDNYLPFWSKSEKDDTYISISPKQGKTKLEKEDLDRIALHPHATKIIISRLTQETFEYFVTTFGQQFTVIDFSKCPLIADLSCLETLSHVEFIIYYWNQRATSLWDFSKTSRLRGLGFDDFTKMRDLSQLTRSSSLQELHFGDRIEARSTVDTLEPLKDCVGLRCLSFNPKKIADNRIEPLVSLKNLEYLDFSANLFSTQQVAWLKVHLPNSVNSPVLRPYKIIANPLEWQGRRNDVAIVGKRKPWLDSSLHAEKIEKYTHKFADMVDWFSNNLAALPVDYPNS